MVPIHKITGRLGNQMFQTAYIYSQFKKGLIKDIYVQDFNYFKDYENEIKELFGSDIGYLSEVAIHIRRGDYVNNPFYVDLTTTDYYKNAIALFPDKAFIVFSDDIEFCKEYFKTNFPNLIVAFSEGNDEVTDLNIMASCSSQIIANSSYSYWAGFLNPNPAKKVIYPKEWFTDKQERITFPDKWLKL